MRQRTVVFDLETGGLDPHIHPVIQYAAIAVDDRWQVLESIHRRISFDVDKAEPEALKRNSYSEELWRSAMDEATAATDLCRFFGVHATIEKISKAGKLYRVARLCAHNAVFDCNFLAAWYKRLNLFVPAAIYEPLDTLALARWCGLMDPKAPSNYKLETVCRWLGVELKEAHDALADVRATAECARLLRARLYNYWPAEKEQRP